MKRTYIRRRLAVAAAMVSLMGAFGFRELPTSSPAATASTTRATANSTGSAAREPANAQGIQTLVDNLSSTDSERRDAAYRGLLALRRADLPSLRQAVAAGAPFTPGLVEYLKRAVQHVYLSEQDYPGTDQGFLGLQMLGISLVSRSVDAAASEARGNLAILITDCQPGMAAFRYLEVGDIVLEVGGKRGVDPTVRLQEIIRNAGAGAVVGFKVLRGGKVISVKIKLSRRPVDFETRPIGASLVEAEWMKPADAYWEREFAPLFPRDRTEAGQP